MLIKDKNALSKMRTAGQLLAEVMQEVSPHVLEGASTWAIDAVIEEKMRVKGLRPECKGYAGYKYASCISLNDVVVHGVPSKEIILKSGDFVKIDVVGSHKGYCADMARYFFIGEVSPVAKVMAGVAQRALDAAINKIVPGIKISDISACIQQIVEKEGFSVVRDFAGHGIGKHIHEAPEVPNYGKRGVGVVLQEGMTLAIEPMITERGYEVYIEKDGWTARTVDGGLAAHVEDTVVITKDGTEIFTRLQGERQGYL